MRNFAVSPSLISRGIAENVTSSFSGSFGSIATDSLLSAKSSFVSVCG